MDYQDTKSIRSLDAPSIGSNSAYHTGASNFFSGPKDNVKVVIRVRPLNDKEKNLGNGKKCISVENSTTVVVDGKPDSRVFNFDFVGHENLDQETVFNQIAKPIADSCLEGYNGSIFAYGQTGAGKTFTIQGSGLMLSGYGYYDQKITETEDYESRGLMSRSFEYIFDSIQNAKSEAESSKGEVQYESLVRCSYLEIYNEQIMDLLDPESFNLHIREDIKKGVYVEGLNEEVVTCAQDMVDLILRGSKNRHVGSTSMNKESSRSHSVLTTIIETKSMKDGGGLWNIKSSRFHIIDLAGSERQKYTNAMGERLKEAGMINKSLSALGNVINSLVDISEGKNRHVHYRDSKLTFLLRDSLGGNSKTVIIANISPSLQCMGETVSTLKFAQRAKLIRNKAVINEDSSGTIHLLKKEINRLKKELAETEQRFQSSSLQCAFCRNNLNGEPNLEDDLNEDEMLLDQSILNQSVNLSSTMALDKDESMLNGENKVVNEQFVKKFKQQRAEVQNMRKRVVYLEGLLSANLDNLTSQQKFYESEFQKGQQQAKRLQQAVDSYEKQCARDKMIIKFREDRIQKLESHQPMTQDDKQKQISDLKKEVQLWKDAVDHNAQSAKLFAEKADLQKQLDQLKKEAKQTPDSLNAQMRSLIELNEGLNEYLRLYCEESKKEVEQELSRVKLDLGEKIEEFNVKIEELNQKEQEWAYKHEVSQKEWNHQVSQYKAEIEVLKEKNVQEKEEIERLNKEAFEQIKKEIEEISENKTEQEKEAQVLKVQLKEKERDIERELQKKEEIMTNFQQKEQELQENIENLQSSIKQLEQIIQRDKEQARSSIEEISASLEQEKKNSSQKFKHESENWEKKLKEIERQFMAEQSEREMKQEECEKLTSRLKQLECENETFQQTLLCKEEEIEEIKRNLKQSEKDLQDLRVAEQSNREQISSKEREVTNLRNELGKAIKDCEELKETLKEIREEMDQLESVKKQLEEEIQVQKKEIEELKRENEQLKRQIQEDSEKYQSTQSSQVQQFEAQIVQLKQEKVEVETKLKERVEEVYVLASEKKKQEEEIVQISKQIEEVQLEKTQSIQVLESKTEIFESEKVQLQELHSQEIKQLELKYSQEAQELQENLEKTLKERVESLTESAKVQFESFKSNNEQELSKFQSQIKDLRTQLSQKEKLLSENTSSITQTENSFKLQIMKQEREFNEQLKALETKHKTLQKEKEEEISQAKQEYQSKETHILIDFEILKKEFEQERVKMQSSLETKQKEHEESQKHYSTLVQRLEEEISSNKTQIEQLQTENGNLNQTSSSQVQNLQEQLNEKTAKVEKLNAQWREQMQVNQNQMESLEQVNAEIKSLQDKLEKVQKEKAEMINSYQEVKQSDSQKQEMMKDLQGENSKLKKDLESQKKLHDDSLNSMNAEHIKKYQQIQSENQSSQNALQVEIDTYKTHCKDLNSQLAKYKQKSEECNEMIRANKQTISDMVVKENNLMLELEKKINELKDHQDKWKVRVQEIREEKDQLRKEWERLKKENENLRELVKLKDRQIEEQLNQDERERDQSEKLFKENKDLRNQLTKREFEMKEVVRTLKFYSEEKTRLEKELEKLHRENDQLIGHKNPSQKIQHHLKIKEENNKLREENFKLQEELRRKTDILIKKGISMSKDQSPQKAPLQQTNENVPEPSKDDMKKLKKENMTYQETINRLVDHILSQPGMMKLIGINDDIFEKIQQSTGQTKVKNAMEVISLFNNVIQNKDRELKDIVREKKKVECRLDIIEKEKNLCKQQLELIQNAGATHGQAQNNSQAYLHSKSPHGFRESDYGGQQNQNSKRRLEGIGSQERVQNEFGQYGQKSPMYGYKQQFPQKDAINSRKELFGGQRNASGLRQQYMHSNNQHQK